MSAAPGAGPATGVSPAQTSQVIHILESYMGELEQGHHQHRHGIV